MSQSIVKFSNGKFGVRGPSANSEEFAFLDRSHPLRWHSANGCRDSFEFDTEESARQKLVQWREIMRALKGDIGSPISGEAP